MYVVGIDKGQKPVFPDQCIVSGGKPNDITCLYRTRIPILSVLTLWIPILSVFFLKTGQKFHIPIQRDKKILFIGRRYLQICLIIIFCMLGLYIYDLMEIDNRALRPLFALVAIMPLIIWQAISPPLMDVEIQKNVIVFEFRNLEYATTFAKLNDCDVRI